jgi:nitrogen fixation/metabolism regulation signal transduction histidine kinase
MMRGNRLRSRLVMVYLAATLLPIVLTVWTSIELLDLSHNLAPVQELEETSKALERLGREYYQRARESLAADAASGRLAPRVYKAGDVEAWPATLREFVESGEPRRFQTSGPRGGRLELIERGSGEVRVYTRELGIGMDQIAAQFTSARTTLEHSRTRDWRRGFSRTLIAVCSTVWLAGLAFLIYWANRVSTPVQRLAGGLRAVASGDLSARIPVDRDDEVGAATAAFNIMADQLAESREKLIRATRLESWQAVARKTAHEVKNSLTPIRLTMEEIIARQTPGGDDFLPQAAQIVVDEVMSLERRVRAFSELAAEPPVTPVPLDVNGVVEERVAFLRAAHPEVTYDARLDPSCPRAIADPDLIKGMLTNLMENAADAVSIGGVVRIKTALAQDRVAIEVHDSGPGLSPQARISLFQPTISFKKNGMGLGLSIARKSALLCGGDVILIDGDLGGAAFRILLREEQYGG